MLAALLLEPGRVVATDRLLDAVWGVEPPTSAVASLQSYISNLRRLLRDADGTTSPIARRAHGYVLEVGTVVLQGTGQDLLVDDNVRKTYLGEA